MKRVWGLSAAVFALSGWAIVSLSHQSVPNRIAPGTPGSNVISFDQPFAWFGKGVGAICFLGTVTTLVLATKPEPEPQPRLALPPARSRQPQNTTYAEVVYDDDVAIDLDSLDAPLETEVSLPVAPPVLKKAPGSLPIDLIALSEKKKRHVFFACQTQSGKTTTVLSAIERKNELTQGQCTWTIIDPKQSYWLGLEGVKVDNQSCVTHMDYRYPSDILKLKAKLDWLVERMAQRQQARKKARAAGQSYNSRPHVTIFDEWPSILKLARDYDEEQKELLKRGDPQPPSIFNYILRKVELLILNGLEDNIIIWLITQMPDLKQNHLDAGMRDQFGYWCQGRDGDFVSIEGALINNWIVKGQGRTLTQQLDQWKAKAGDLPIVYTNIGGHRMFEMTEIPESIKSKQLFGEERKTNLVQFQKPQTNGAMAIVPDLQDEDEEDYW